MLGNKLPTFQYTKPFSRFIFIVLGVFGTLAGCLSVPQVETAIHESQQGRVILKTFIETSGKASHPMVIDLHLLTETLRGLRVQEQKELLAVLVSGEGQELSVFTEQELQFLAPLLRDALAQATPEEYVWFQLIEQKHTSPISTSGFIYFFDNLLQVGLNEFQEKTRHTKLSSKPSFSPTQLRHWTLKFFPVEGNHQVDNATDMIPMHAQIGSVAIAMKSHHNVSESQKLNREEGTHSQPGLEYQEKKTNEVLDIKEEIGELQQQLEEQNKKLRQLENRLEQNRGQER